MRVIPISGKARHGKDTCAEMLNEYLTDHGYRVLITHYGDLVKYVCKKFFDWDGRKDDKGRALLQYVGTDVVRSKVTDYWCNFIVDMLNFFGSEWDFVLIPDTRFPNEIECLRNNGFFTTHLRVIRPDFDNGLTTVKDIVVDSVVEGSKELVRDASKIGLIVGVGVFGYFNGYGEVIMKQMDEAKRLGKYLENLADDLYLK